MSATVQIVGNLPSPKGMMRSLPTTLPESSRKRSGRNCCGCCHSSGSMWTLYRFTVTCITASPVLGVCHKQRLWRTKLAFKAVITIAIRLRYDYDTTTIRLRRIGYKPNCDSTTIRLRYNDTTTHSTTTEVIEISICVRFHCDTTTTRLRRKIDMFIFCSRRMEAGARDTS